MILSSVAPLCDTPITSDMHDASDLHAWTGQRDEAAFARLCQRHAGIVHAVCLRALGSEAHAADDCCQAVFIVLARRAGDIRQPAFLPGWLHQTALLCVRNWQRQARRRRQHEAQVPVPTPQPPPDDHHDLRPLLDRALASLSDAQRNAVLARYWNDRGPGEIGRDLGISPDAVRMRIQAGIEGLRRWFARQGVSVTTVAIATALTRAITAEPVAPTLIEACTRTSRDLAAPAQAIADLPSTGTWTWLAGGSVVIAATLTLGVLLPQRDPPAAAAAEAPPAVAALGPWDVPVTIDLRGATPIEILNQAVRSQPDTEDLRLVWPPRLRWGGPVGGIDLAGSQRPLRLVVADLAQACGCAVAWRGNLAILYDRIATPPDGRAITGSEARPVVESADPTAVGAVLAHLDQIGTWRDAGLRSYSWNPPIGMSLSLPGVAQIPDFHDRWAELLFRHPAVAATPAAAREALLPRLDATDVLHLSAFVDADVVLRETQLARLQTSMNLDVVWHILLDGEPAQVQAAVRLLPEPQTSWLRLIRTLAQREAVGDIILGWPATRRDQALTAVAAAWRRWPAWLQRHIATRNDPPWSLVRPDAQSALDAQAIRLLRWRAEPAHLQRLLQALPAGGPAAQGWTTTGTVNVGFKLNASGDHDDLIDALLCATDAASVPHLVGRLHQADGVDIADAILVRVLGRSTLPEARRSLEQLVTDPDPELRVLAARQLLLGRQPGSLARILALAGPDRPEADRCTAAASLPCSRQVQARTAWEQLCTDASVAVRAAAVAGAENALGASTGTFDLAAAQDAWGRGCAAGLLAALDRTTPRAMPVLVTRLLDDERVMTALLRWAATAETHELADVVCVLGTAATRMGMADCTSRFRAILTHNPTLSAGAHRLGTQITAGSDARLATGARKTLAANREKSQVPVTIQMQVPTETLSGLADLLTQVRPASSDF